MYSNLGFEYMFGSLAPRGRIMVFGMFLVYFRCHMTFGDKPRHDGEAGTTQSVRLWKKASLFSILSITHRSEVQLMQGQRRWKDNSIVYNFDVDTMVQFRIMKEHDVFLRWNCPRKLQGPNTARNTACSIWSTPCPTPRRVFKSFSFSNLVQKPINTPETPVDEIYFIIHIFSSSWRELEFQRDDWSERNNHDWGRANHQVEDWDFHEEHVVFSRFSSLLLWFIFRNHE